eukprot:4905221-Prymnesium_polylepis.1
MLAPFGVAAAVEVVNPLSVPDVDLDVALRVSRSQPASDRSPSHFWPKHGLTIARAHDCLVATAA